jgi:tRNA (adenine57-N1/adenine58-N1)-methyltransferase catalytic subunit
MPDIWREGETGTLKRPGEPALLVRLSRGAQRIGGEGVLDISAQIGKPPGGEVEWLGSSYRLLRPSLADLLGSLRRGAQIVTPKDAVYLGYLAGVGPGAQVIEAGTGSGALTIALAWMVGPTGRVTTYDRRADFLDVAQRNARAAGLADRVTFRQRDVAEDGFDLSGVSAVVLDLPEPWVLVEAARVVLVPGGHLATFSPTYNQLERTVRALREHEYDEVRAVELLERALHVGDGGTRPEFDMLGHTGFLASGRKVA